MSEAISMHFRFRQKLSESCRGLGVLAHKAQRDVRDERTSTPELMNQVLLSVAHGTQSTETTSPLRLYTTVYTSSVRVRLRDTENGCSPAEQWGNG